MYMCPSCGRTLGSLYALKKHYRSCCDRCPFCNWRYKKIASHAHQFYASTKDKRHLALYWLTTTANNKNRKLFKEGLKAAEEVFYVGDKV